MLDVGAIGQDHIGKSAPVRDDLLQSLDVGRPILGAVDGVEADLFTFTVVQDADGIAAAAPVPVQSTARTEEPRLSTKQ